MPVMVRFDPFTVLREGPVATHAVAMDAIRRGDDVVVTFDLPGIDPAGIDLTVEQESLTLAVERRTERREGDRVLVAERPTGRFTRSVRLSERLDTSRVQAAYADGVLTVTIPLAETAKPRKVAVQGAAQPAIETTGHEAEASSEG
jgi:HSP20 family protein